MQNYIFCNGGLSKALGNSNLGKQDTVNSVVKML